MVQPSNVAVACALHVYIRLCVAMTHVIAYICAYERHILRGKKLIGGFADQLARQQVMNVFAPVFSHNKEVHCLPHASVETKHECKNQFLEIQVIFFWKIKIIQ